MPSLKTKYSETSIKQTPLGPSQLIKIHNVKEAVPFFVQNSRANLQFIDS